jgi:hypothetical protein
MPLEDSVKTSTNTSAVTTVLNGALDLENADILLQMPLEHWNIAEFWMAEYFDSPTVKIQMRNTKGGLQLCAFDRVSLVRLVLGDQYLDGYDELIWTAKEWGAMIQSLRYICGGGEHTCEPALVEANRHFHLVHAADSFIENVFNFAKLGFPTWEPAIQDAESASAQFIFREDGLAALSKVVQGLIHTGAGEIAVRVNTENTGKPFLVKGFCYGEVEVTALVNPAIKADF